MKLCASVSCGENVILHAEVIGILFDTAICHPYMLSFDHFKPKQISPRRDLVVPAIVT